ncbi:MAG TPA: class E sortase [Nocardioidaceae bacterium]
MTRLATAACAAILPLALAGCSSALGTGSSGSPAPASDSPSPSAVASSTAAPSADPKATPSASRPSHTTRARPESDGRPRRATLAIPAIGVRALVVHPYRGTPDDAAGTRIQDRGAAASPHGPGGGAGPGGIGNYIVTAHRTSSTRAFAELPDLRVGDRVHVRAAGTRYTYRITKTRSTSFRSPRSLARQSAAVPGRPGRTPTRAMITLSTCATPEDRAAGNYWSDEFGNPEHRIDKVGVLVGARPVR